MTTMNFQITGVHCGGCASKVRHQVEQVPGTRTIEVDPAAGAMKIEGDQSLNAAAVVAAVEKAGYEAVLT